MNTVHSNSKLGSSSLAKKSSIEILVTNGVSHKLLDVRHCEPPKKKKCSRNSYCSGLVADSLQNDSSYLCNVINTCFLIKTRKTSELIILYGEAHNTVIESLVDTGASTSYISARCYDELLDSAYETDGIHFEPCETKVKLADDTFVEPLGIATIALFVVDRILQIPMIVIKNLAYDTILGMEHLKENKIVIDPDELSVYFKEKDESISNIITLEDTITIPPFSQISVPVSFKQTFKTTQVVRNLQVCNQKYGVFIAQGPIHCDVLTATVLLKRKGCLQVYDLNLFCM